MRDLAAIAAAGLALEGLAGFDAQYSMACSVTPGATKAVRPARMFHITFAPGFGPELYETLGHR